MSYDLYIGDRTFSSWSLRGWLMFVKFGLPVRTHLVGLYDGTMAEDLARLAPARFVPCMTTPEGIVVGDTMAMAETLAETHRDVAFYPEEPAARALARWMVAEMHSGFAALRGECPMQLLHQFAGFEVSEAVRGDLDRIETLWALARSRHGTVGPWLFGDYSLADVFFAPVCARIAGYGLSVGAEAQAYVDQVLKDATFRQWRAMGLCKTYDPLPYARDLPTRDWPGPASLVAHKAEGPSVNTDCPYSGDPVTDFLSLDGVTYGFCNPFCRDKTLHDPAAWPRFLALVEGR
ncbi:glutathione S-transferase [Maritimibacter sp. DP1N21-5]|uniref:glutathione S-transferase n=1 Tax=Maritimibacter sp. DP1N21-5 TaxID=2836867 RepID=UPI001C481775|nr:glutathione S-transferase [Maritimibacter sp. DP1N21-5]MBV7408587.1 glutathione S-transferase [Maritimibacter sp. DP1N21-5]